MRFTETQTSQFLIFFKKNLLSSLREIDPLTTGLGKLEAGSVKVSELREWIAHQKQDRDAAVEPEYTYWNQALLFFVEDNIRFALPLPRLRN